MKKIRLEWSSGIAVALAVIMVALLPSCKGLSMAKADEDEELPERPGERTLYLPAKVAAYRHAMENLPSEEKRYGEDFYAAAGIHDLDAAHTQVLILALADMFPPVVDAKTFYDRDQNSKWVGGKPAMVWTSKVTDVTEDNQVTVVVGWMHSNLLYQFYEYKVDYIERSDSWKVVGYEPMARAGE